MLLIRGRFILVFSFQMLGILFLYPVSLVSNMFLICGVASGRPGNWPASSLANLRDHPRGFFLWPVFKELWESHPQTELVIDRSRFRTNFFMPAQEKKLAKPGAMFLRWLWSCCMLFWQGVLILWVSFNMQWRAMHGVSMETRKSIRRTKWSELFPSDLSSDSCFSALHTRCEILCPNYSTKDVTFLLWSPQVEQDHVCCQK